MRSDAALYPPFALKARVSETVAPAQDHSVRVGASRCDEDLIADLGDGNPDCLAELFRRHASSVLNVVDRILRDRGEAEDVLQEVFTFVFQKAAMFDPAKGSGASWIVQIAYHRAIDRRRHLSRRNHYDSRSVEEDHLCIPRQGSVVDEVAARALLSRMRHELSAEQVETLELHFFEGYTFHEIAEKTGRSFGAVRHHYYRGLERLRSFVFGERQAPR